ncbi:MAG TPA: polysaccharide pyruvyl transferase family protein [Burkholderiales bacterium]|nr:polysaccharide pyruvyl transferase family protein [Burkholderiales bacterium]
MTALSEAVVRPRISYARPSSRAPRIGVIYPSGWGNLGDEAILQSTFNGIRARWPDAELRAFTLHPARTASNHGVSADELTGITRPMFLSPRGDGPFVVRAARGVARRTQRIPLLGAIADAGAQLTSAIVFESTALVRAWQWIRTADLVLAAGGGQLDAAWGGAWGQPYALARWAWLAKKANVPFAFLSVGFGSTKNRLSRTFMRYAVQRAVYCSVRDEGSRKLTAGLGVKRELQVVPDLAFALETKAPLKPRRPGYDIGLSPMVFLKPGGWPDDDAAKYEGLVTLWCQLVSDRIRKGDRLHIFVSDPGDMDAVRDVWSRLSESERASCSIIEADSPGALLEFYRGLDLVISSRLHGVLLAIVAGRPVAALAHERKVRAVMDDAGMSRFCTNLESATVESVDSILAALTTQLDICSRQLREYADSAKRAVVAQEGLISSLLRRQP